MAPLFQKTLGGATQLPENRSDSFAPLDVEINGSDSVFVGIHELPPGSPGFCLDPREFIRQLFDTADSCSLALRQYLPLAPKEPNPLAGWD